MSPGMKSLKTSDAAGRRRFGFRRLAIAAVISAMSVFAVFSPLLRAPFLYDDQSVILNDEVVIEAENAKTISLLANLWKKPRPLRQLTHRIEWRLFADNPAPPHAMNIIMHLAVGMLWWRLLRKRLGIPAAAAGLATALFLLNPVTVESLGVVSHRKEMLGAMFALAGLDAALSALPSISITAIICFALAAAGKETAIVAPLLLPLLALCAEWSGFDGNPDVKREAGAVKSIRTYCSYAILAIALAALSWWQIQAGMAFAGWNPGAQEARAGHLVSGAPWPAAFSSSIRALPRSLAMVAWPIGHAPDPAISLAIPLLSPETALSMLSFAAAATVIILLLRRHDVLGPAFAWFWIALAPCVFPPMLRCGATAILADRYLYFPSLGFALCAALTLGRLPRKASIAATIALIAVYASASFTISRHYRDPVEYWGWAARANKASTLAAHNHAFALWRERGDFAGAEREFRRMLALAPDFDYGICTRAQMHYEENDPDTALEIIDSAMRKRPRSMLLTRQRALFSSLYNEDPGRTLAFFKAAAKLGADDAVFHAGYGVALQTALDWPSAAKEFAAAGNRSPLFADESREANFLVRDPPSQPSGVLLVLGDSVPHGTGTATDDDAELSLADALSKGHMPLGAAKAVDLSVPGSVAADATTQLGNYISSQNDMATPISCCVILSGHNDAFLGVKTFDILSALADAVLACRKAGAVPVVVGPIHVRDEPGKPRGHQERTLALLDHKLAAFCKRAGSIYVSAGRVLGNNEEGSLFYDARSGNHLSRSGIVRLAEAVAASEMLRP